mmetsp:Transcript_35308/g.77155  ORF Transcript_35308/g.77155 Transcript_35308/m.77155 type:complete len:296 (+) Transcript_35308:104-991(+)
MDRGVVRTCEVVPGMGTKISCSVRKPAGPARGEAAHRLVHRSSKLRLHFVPQPRQRRQHVSLRHHLLRASGDGPYRDLSALPFGRSQHDGMRSVDFLSILEACHWLLLGPQEELGGAAAAAHSRGDASGIRIESFVQGEDDNIHLWTQILGEKSLGGQKLHDHCVSEAEASSRHVLASEGLQKLVVATSSGDGSKLALPVEGLEDDARVVGETPHNGEVRHEPIPVAIGLGQAKELRELAKSLRILSQHCLEVRRIRGIGGGLDLAQEKIDGFLGETGGLELLHKLLPSELVKLV